MNDGLIQVDGKFYKESDVVTLPTEKASQISFQGKKLCYWTFNVRYANSQHLYFLSDEEIKEGDYAFDFTQNKIIKVTHGWKYLTLHEKYKKIIATTDESLGLPRPSNSFIKKYCELGGIDKVLVQITYTKQCVKCNKDFINYVCECGEDSNYKYNQEYKVASDNTITIKPFVEKFDVEKFACEKYGIREGLKDYDERYFNSYNVAKAEAFIEGFNKAKDLNKQR